MKIQDQVITLEQAKRLNELGIAQRSFLYHFQDRILFEAWGADYYSAFTVAELGVMLPTFLSGVHDGENVLLEICPTTSGNIWQVLYAKLRRDTSLPAWKLWTGGTMAEAMAKMLIYLLENKHITADEVNQRLQS